MSGFRSKKLASAGRGIEITGLTEEQHALLTVMWGFSEEADLQEWQDSLSLRQSQLVDSLILTMLLEHFDHLLNMETDYTLANEYLQRFRLNS